MAIAYKNGERGTLGLQICGPKDDPFQNGNVHYKMEGVVDDSFQDVRSGAEYRSVIVNLGVVTFLCMRMIL